MAPKSATNMFLLFRPHHQKLSSIILLVQKLLTMMLYHQYRSVSLSLAFKFRLGNQNEGSALRLRLLVEGPSNTTTSTAKTIAHSVTKPNRFENSSISAPGGTNW